MKYISILIITMLLVSCNLTETINLNSDGSGNIEIYSRRDENSIDKLGRPTNKKEEFKDTTSVFRDYIKKYQDNFVQYNESDQESLLKHADVKMHLKMDPAKPENFSVTSYDFKKTEEIPDVLESFTLSKSLKEKTPLVKQFFKIKYSFDGSTFKREVVVVDQMKHDRFKKEFENRRRAFTNPNLAQSYILRYNFPRKIKSISNQNAIISSDKKAITLEFDFSDCLQDPTITNLEVVLE